MRLFGLIGSPLTHSFSKKYFSRKFEEEGLEDCRYELFPLATIAELPGLLDTNPELEGLNVTIPYKKQVLSYLAAVEIPEGLHACNCIRIKGGRLTGYNTDVAGFEKSVSPLLKPWHSRALVLGNGGATEAVIFVLKKLGIRYQVVSRSLHTGSDLTYADLDKETVRQHNLIINTTPLGTFPDTGSCPPVPYEGITEKHLLYDLVYNPSKTLFLQKGEARGAGIKNGEDMLVIQAEESWKIWNRS